MMNSLAVLAMPSSEARLCTDGMRDQELNECERESEAPRVATFQRLLILDRFQIEVGRVNEVT